MDHCSVKGLLKLCRSLALNTVDQSVLHGKQGGGEVYKCS